jgi:VWFA-related protein
VGRFSSVLALLFIAAALLAQEETVFKTDVKVVNTLASVRNKQGAYVRDLTRDDFVLSEDGRPQTIRYFAKQSDLPLKLGLLIDTSVSQNKVMSAERVAAAHFFDDILRLPEDRVSLVQFDNKILLKQDFTANLAKLEEAMAFVDTPSHAELRNQIGAGTLLYDAVVYAANDIMASQQGRKAVILLTDGVDTCSEGSITNAIEAALKSDTLIYSILFSDSGYYGGFGVPDGKKILMRMSRETGGGFFQVSKKQSIDQIFSMIEDELRSQYSIGYISDKPVAVSEFRKVQLATKQKGLTVQSRERYWARR